MNVPQGHFGSQAIGPEPLPRAQGGMLDRDLCIPQSRLWCRLALLLFLMLLVSCSGFVSAVSADLHVTLRSQERWEADMELVYSPEQVRANASAINSAIEAIASRIKAGGGEADLLVDTDRDDGNVSYRLSSRGVGLDSLNAAFFDGTATLSVSEDSGDRQVIFRYVPTYSLTGLARDRTFTLVGGRILATNGTRVDNATVTWRNPADAMAAVLTEAPRFPWLPYALILVGCCCIALVIVAGVVWRNRAGVSVPAPMGIRDSAAYCTACGWLLPSEARFCPNCGIDLQAD
jgi:hypothetical protein